MTRRGARVRPAGGIPPHGFDVRGQMIDRAARDRLAEGIRHLAAGMITNVEFEDAVLSSSPDPAVHAVFLGGPWFLYHDLMRYRLTGAHRLSPAVRRDAARWVLFLKSDLPYEWPIERRGMIGALLRVVLNILTIGFVARNARRRFTQSGDLDVWPFVRQSDYEVALHRPPYLAEPRGVALKGGAPGAARV